MRIAPLRDGMYVISGYTNGNIVADVGRRSVLLVDGQSARRVGLADSALRTVTTLPVSIVINTHYHGDHTEGNPHWKAQGARVIGQLLEADEARRDTVIPELSWRREPLGPEAMPDEYVKEELRIPFEHEVIALHAPRAHTSGDLIVWFTQANVIHTGDLVEFEAPPFLDSWGGGTLEGIIAGVDRILRMADDRTIIVPGHGPPTTRAEVVRYRGALVTLRDRVNAAVAAGKTMDQFVGSAPAAEFAGMFNGTSQLPRFARLLWLGATRDRAAARADRVRARLAVLFDSVRAAGGQLAGAEVGVVFDDWRTLAWATGVADPVSRRPLGPTDLLPTGTAGNTFLQGVALDLAQEGKLDLRTAPAPDASLADEVQERILEPLALTHVRQSADGIAASAEDLARWAQVLWSGRAFSDSLRALAFQGVPTPVGLAYGKGAVFPGGLTVMRYYADLGVAVAVQVVGGAATDGPAIGRLCDEIGRMASRP
jgi:cyclase